MFTCRHTHEPRLVEELGRIGCDNAEPLSDIPGLVAAHGLPDVVNAATLAKWDPVWALQVLPATRALHAPSINRLAAAVTEHLLEPIDALPGPWRLHVIAPGALKGQPQPKLQQRADRIAESIGRQLQKTRRRAWRRQDIHCHTPCFIAQVLLRDPEHIWLSMSQTNVSEIGGTWPSAWPAGLAHVADDPVAPSSAFRKLDEALFCMGRRPLPGATAVDLGASPGGWTRVLLRHGADVVAVDRAPLADHLMAEQRLQWIGGDAFTYVPEAPVDWLVSDIIAFPERVAELLDTWCGRRLATNVVVQMKFQGGTNWRALEDAMAVAQRHGYAVRAKHFFNDKNEVTLMAIAPPPAP